MGADLWHHESDWHPDAAVALLQAQARLLAERYDLASLLPHYLQCARAGLAAARAAGDPYCVAGVCETEVHLLEELIAQALPEDTQAKIRILRRVHASSGAGIGNILDIVRVSEERSPLAAQLLSEAECQRLTGAAKPTLQQARDATGAIFAELRRGECVCFPVYDEHGEPTGWCFVGATVD